MAYFQRRVASRTDAEDLTQEVFLRLARHPEVHELEPADTYIFTVAANLLRDRARRGRARSRDRHVPVGTDGDAPLGAELIETLEPERILLARNGLARVLHALDEAPSRTRDVFLLFRLEGMRQKEIAQLYGISVSAVEKHVVKALKQLARELP